MNSLSNNRSSAQPTSSSISTLFKKLTRRVVALFEPEEVEISFRTEGNGITYKYTKISDKQVA